MRRKLIIGIFTVILIILTAVQITIDNRIEREFGRDAVDVAKKNNYCIFVEVQDNTLYLLQNDKCIKQYRIASGKPGEPSPIGFWKIIEKSDWGEGFGGRWMGFNVPWGKYGIHGTIFPNSIGWASSHGCIRMYNKDVTELYKIVPHGTPVVIVNGSFGPFGSGFRNISPGDRGADVYAIQQRLKELGFFKGYVSGIYNDDLKYALNNFQKKNKLPVSNTISKRDWLAMGFREFE